MDKRLWEENDWMLSDKEIYEADGGHILPHPVVDRRGIADTQFIKMVDRLEEPCHAHPLGQGVLQQRWGCPRCKDELHTLLMDQLGIKEEKVG